MADSFITILHIIESIKMMGTEVQFDGSQYKSARWMDLSVEEKYCFLVINVLVLKRKETTMIQSLCILHFALI